MSKKYSIFLGILVVLALSLSLTHTALAQDTPPNQTTLSATKTATGHMVRTFHWTIDKSVSPDSWDLFTGDGGTSEYTIDLTKDEGTDAFYVDGQICVTNGGAVPTDDLAILDEVQYKVPGEQFDELTSAPVDLGDFGELAPGESHCYSYSIDLTPVAGAEYRNVAHVTITNHAGHQPGDQNCSGPDLCSFGPNPKADFSIPAEPDTLVNDTINVEDTNEGVGPWEFSGSDSVNYDKTFTCDDAGTNDNTATIVETGQDSSASVDVTCYDLEVTKDANTSFDRTYVWNVDKSADQSNLTLSLNQSWVVNYTVVVSNTDYEDSDWAVEGEIDVYNPAPMAATINDLTDIVSDDIQATVLCNVSFPYELASEDTLVCTYSAALPDAADRTNTATATLQNYSYDSDQNASEDGTTDYQGYADVTFDAKPTNELDTCVDVEDSLYGTLGHFCLANLVNGQIQIKYTGTVGPYTICGPYLVSNVAALTTVDTGAYASDYWDVNINVPCGGCTLTIGYWKTHAGLGPQPDMVSAHLPQWLGLLAVTTPVQANSILSFNGSNGVFDPSNGINKLYAQLLAAQLNIANGANGSSISTTITQANLWLITHNSTSWAGLSKNQQKQVLAWMTALDNYNNGLTGPGHCSQ